MCNVNIWIMPCFRSALYVIYVSGVAIVERIEWSDFSFSSIFCDSLATSIKFEGGGRSLRNTGIIRLNVHLTTELDSCHAWQSRDVPWLFKNIKSLTLHLVLFQFQNTIFVLNSFIFCLLSYFLDHFEGDVDFLFRDHFQPKYEYMRHQHSTTYYQYTGLGRTLNIGNIIVDICRC